MRQLELVGLLNHRDVTGADISPSGDVLALACYDDGWSYRDGKKIAIAGLRNTIDQITISLNIA